MVISAAGVRRQPQKSWRDKDRRRKLIVDAATEVFAERGYQAATLREIAKQAGCSMSLIARYFEGKPGLFLAAIEQRLTEAEHILTAKPPAEATLAEDLLSDVVRFLDMTWASQGMSRVLWGQVSVDEELGRTLGQDMRERSLRAYQELLLRHARDGGLRPGISVRAAANLLEAMSHYLSFLCQIVWRVERDEVRWLAEQFVRIVCDGILAAPAAPGDRTTGDHPPRSESERALLIAYRNASPEVRRLIDAAAHLDLPPAARLA